MINPEHLRIGNFATIIDRRGKVHLPTGVVYKIVELKTFTASLVRYDENPTQVEQYIEVPYKDLEPIELTEERLIDFGCSECDSAYEYAKTKDYTHNLFYIDMANQSILYRNNGVIDYSKIEHVHQLQNLTFALTNQELTRK